MKATSSGSIIATRDAVAARRVSAEEAVRAALDRIDERDRDINAVVALRAENALAEARELDGRIARGETPGPLAGVPVLVKDLEDVAGMTTTMGSALFKDATPATADGLVPARLRAAGAIVVGKTSLPEFACESYTANLPFGITRNPWGLEWSPGGSSGGSAAALVAGMVPIATATDGGGSIRIPSAFCGLVGLKPTNGVIARRPIPDWIDYSTDGPFTTTVDDLRLLMQLESGPEPGDPTAPPVFEQAPLPAKLRILAAVRIEPGPEPPAAVSALFDRALRNAEDAFGVRVEQVDASPLWAPAATEEDWLTVVATEHVHRFGREFVIANLERMSPAGQGFMRFGLEVTVDQYLAARRRRFEFVRAMDDLLGEDAVLLSPTMLVEGILADGRLNLDDEPWSLPTDIFNTGIANMTGSPAVSIPAGICPNGLPFGLQIIAPHFREGWLLDLAAKFEERNPWPRTAPGYDPFESALGI